MRRLFTLFSIAFLKTAFFAQYGFGLIDEGESLHNARRILSGDLPYRDFFAIFPPLDNYFYAIVFSIFGESVFVPRLIAGIIFSATPVLIFLISKRFMSKTYAILPALLIIFLDVNIERIFFFTPLLLGLYLFLVALEDKKNNLFFWSGVSFGVASLIRFAIPGAFVLAAIIGAALHCHLLSRRGWFKRWITLCFRTGIGFALPAGSAVVWMLKQGLFFSFIESAFYKSVLITKLHALPFPSLNDLLAYPVSLASLSKAYTAIYGYSLLTTYAAVSILLFREGRRIWKKAVDIGILLLAGLFTLPYVFGRSDLGHMIKGGFPFLLLGTYLLYRISKTKHLSSKFLLWGIAGSLFVASFGQSLWWLNFNDQKVDFGHNVFYLNSSYIADSTIPSAKTLKESVLFLQTNSQRQEPVLVLPYMAGLYFLADRPTATEFNNLLAGFINTEEGQLEFIRRIKDKDVNLVVYAADSGPKMKTPSLKDYNPLIHAYLMNNFEVVQESQEGWLFMVRKNE